MHPKLGSLRSFFIQNPMLNSYLVSVVSATSVASNITSIQLPRKGVIRKISTSFLWAAIPTAIATLQLQLSLRAAGQFNANVTSPSQILTHNMFGLLFGSAIGQTALPFNVDAILNYPVNVNDAIYLHGTGSVGSGTYNFTGLIWVEE